MLENHKAVRLELRGGQFALLKTFGKVSTLLQTHDRCSVGSEKRKNRIPVLVNPHKMSNNTRNVGLYPHFSATRPIIMKTKIQEFGPVQFGSYV